MTSEVPAGTDSERKPARGGRLEAAQVADAVLRAAKGDERAWELLVDSFAGLVWTVAHSHRLSNDDAADVSQTTWLRLVEHVDRLDDPTRVGAWLATTARRESLRVLAARNRLHLVADNKDLDDLPHTHESPSVDLALLREERAEEVRAALACLPWRYQALLNLLMLDPPPSYGEISAALDIPVGSIGPTRGRCLKKLLELLDERGIGAAESHL